MSDWEADDFDPSAQVADRMVTLGLDTVLKKEAAVKHDSKNSFGGAETGGELTEKQKLERQKQSDKEIAMDLFGIESEKQKTWEDLKKPADFSEHAEIIGGQIASKSKESNYLLFVNTLVKEICQPMTKLQLQTVRDTISKYISAIEKKEEEQKKQQSVKQQVKTKKVVKKELYEDTVEDEYDDYLEKY
uniref:Eukaryotic translation initiation factor 3 30 kDa subunit n=1 Tax=Ditylenchus dipsaci TaxID=166011 RepID=A0A915EB06_9BILA